MEIEEQVLLVQAGDKDAFVPFIHKYQQQLFIYCCRMLDNEQDAEDAVQDVFVKAYRSISSYKPTVHFSAWLYKIAYNHCLNMLRRHRLMRREIGYFTGKTHVESAELSVVNDMLSEPLSHALNQLSPEDRAMLLLHVFHDKNYADIGEIVGKKSPDAVRKKLDRIKRKVVSTLSRMEAEQWEHRAIVHTKN